MSETIQDFIRKVNAEKAVAEAILVDETKTQDERQVALGMADQLHYMLYRMERMNLDLDGLMELSFVYRYKMILAFEFPPKGQTHDDDMENRGRLDAVAWLIDELASILY